MTMPKTLTMVIILTNANMRVRMCDFRVVLHSFNIFLLATCLAKKEGNDPEIRKSLLPFPFSPLTICWLNKAVVLRYKL